MFFKPTAALARLAALSSVFSPLPQAMAQTNAHIEQLLSGKLGTISTIAEPVFSDGTLTGCSVVFNVLIKDFTYKAGGYVKVDGSFNLMAANNNLGIMLKVVLHDLEQKSLALTASSPVSAFFVSGNSTSRPYLIAQQPVSDTPGAVVVLFNAETLPMLVQAVAAETVTIAFAREKGGIDLRVPIDLGVEDTDDNGKKLRSHKAANEFNSCAATMLKSETEKIGKSK
jgi:hypothetical protein